MGDLLKGKVAVVTGAGRGIGQAEALALAAEGASVVVNDLGVERRGGGAQKGPADETVAEIHRRGGEAVANYESVGDYQAAGRIIQMALDVFGRLDILVNNAGIFRDGLFHETTEDDWDSIVTVHLKGTFNTCHHAVPIMMQQRSGRIINTASSQWRNPEGRASYAAAKGGIVSLTYDLAWEMRPYNVTVNAIAPMALTRGAANMTDYNAHVATAGLTRNKPADEANRPAPEFVPPMVVYLATDLAPEVTGCVFRVGAGKVGLYSHPTEIRSIYRNHLENGPWPLEELRALLPSTILQGNPKAPHIS
jgi:NAD(P)-dependent dehydrogenase (short-subunit alcohol dehydrogenase family)